MPEENKMSAGWSLILYRDPMQVLDVRAGSGHNAIFLAFKNFQVIQDGGFHFWLLWQAYQSPCARCTAYILCMLPAGDGH